MSDGFYSNWQSSDNLTEDVLREMFDKVYGKGRQSRESDSEMKAMAEGLSRAGWKIAEHNPPHKQFRYRAPDGTIINGDVCLSRENAFKSATRSAWAKHQGT